MERDQQSGLRETHPPRTLDGRVSGAATGAARDPMGTQPRRPALNRGVEASTLRQIPLFADLDPADLELVADSMHRRLFGAGETLTAEGGAGGGFFVVISGEAEVTVEGRRHGTVVPGDFFGQIALLQGSGPGATVTATGDVHCYVLTPLDFRDVVEGSPSLAWKLVNSMAERLS